MWWRDRDDFLFHWFAAVIAVGGVRVYFWVFAEAVDLVEIGSAAGPFAVRTESFAAAETEVDFFIA